MFRFQSWSNLILKNAFYILAFRWRFVGKSQDSVSEYGGYTCWVGIVLQRYNIQLMQMDYGK